MMPDRRRFLGSLGLGLGGLVLPAQIAFARAASERRLVFIIQRGAADGLGLVPPIGDPDHARLRPHLAAALIDPIKLDGMFALNPALPETARMFAAGEALVVHATASPYRDRSHFDGQNVLETGGPAPYARKDGWLNRLAALVPGDEDRAIAFASTMPAALRGPAHVTSYAPSKLPDPSDDLLARVSALYAEDAVLHPLWEAALDTRRLAGSTSRDADPAAIGRLAATFLARADGPRIAMIETGGWDTHGNQQDRLRKAASGLDAILAALREGMGAEWARTTVLVATEFGRTVRENGTGGTDHGTAAAALILGGAVQGGRVIADWPGLAPGRLRDDRDLAPTIALDAVIAQIAAESFGLDGALVARTLYGAGGPWRPPVPPLIRI